MMRSLRLLVVLLTAIYAAATENGRENEGKCQMPKVSELETLAFTNANQAGSLSEPYPNGTVVEVSCSDGRRIAGTSLKKNSTQCVDGEWKEQLGHCARGCASVAEFDRQHSIGYSNQDKDGKYPDGTKATLSCTHGHPFGRTESLCNDGKWTQKLDHCGSSCSQRAMEEFGYSDMHVDGKRTDGNVTHRTDVEFLCGEKRHEYRCFNGAFRSKHPYRPCEWHYYSCRDGELHPNLESESMCDVEEAGFVAWSDTTHTINDACLAEEGSLKCYPEDLFGCAPPNSTTAEYALPTFTTAAKNGTYGSGTLVNLFCETGPVIDGPSQSRCFGGDWYPPLGRCPPKCNPLQVSDGSVSYTNKYAPKSMVTKGIYSNGTVAQLTCPSGRRTVGKSSVQCQNGQWIPELGHCADGCQELDKANSEGSLSYSASKSNGKYSDGTTATLSCSEGSVVGSSSSKCYDGKWSPMIGYCKIDLSCKFGKKERGWGFSGMFPYDVSTTPNGKESYFKCGKGMYRFKCDRGEWKPVNHMHAYCGSPQTTR